MAFDEKLGKTVKMREKEGAADYRFITDPDLPKIKIEEKMIKEIEKNIPEMPQEKLEKLIKEFKVDKKNAEVLTKNLELVEFFEELAKEGINVKNNLSWITIELLRVLNYNKKTLEDEDVDIKPVHLAELIKAVEEKKITVLKAKQIMNDFVPKSFSLKEHKAEISNIDSAAVENLCRQAINENPNVVEEYKAGKEASLNFLMGAVMRLSERRARPDEVKVTLKKILAEGE